uniref:Uncharacterized protein n=1 Tax=Arundo donax TaxID=35708 RepID=A0A0A9EI69_ARUDO
MPLPPLLWEEILRSHQAVKQMSLIVSYFSQCHSETALVHILNPPLPCFPVFPLFALVSFWLKLWHSVHRLQP